MKTSKKHIINTVFLEVNTTSKEKAFYIKDHLDTFLKEQVFPLLEDRFDALEQRISGKSIQIQRLDLDIEVKKQLDFDEIKNQIVRKVHKELESNVTISSDSKKENSTILNPEESDLKTLFYFLENGTTPWWSGKKEFSFLTSRDKLEEIIKVSDFVSGFVSRLDTPEIRKRLIYQFPDQYIARMLYKTFSNTLDSKDHTWMTAILEDKIIQSIKQLGTENRLKIWEAIILVFKTRDKAFFKKELQNIERFTENKELKNLISLLAQATIANDGQLKTLMNENEEMQTSQSKSLNGKKPEKPKKLRKEDNSSPKENQEELEQVDSGKLEINNDFFDDALESQKEDIISEVENDSEIPENEAYYTDNAGLVLLHPFLKQFFENCELLNDDGSFRDPELAVHLLHYMATKQEQQPENHMIFEKFICNIPIHQTISRNIVIGDTYKNKVEELLEAVIQNWSALQNASPDLLRFEFLQRPGKLMLREKHPKVILERKTQDILIDRLPWNLSLVKLPWHTQLIFVDW